MRIFPLLLCLPLAACDDAPGASSAEDTRDASDDPSSARDASGVGVPAGGNGRVVAGPLTDASPPPSAGACPKSSLMPGDYDRKVTVGSRSRTYHVHVPSRIDGTKAAPLVFAFHGGGQTAAGFEAFAHLKPKSDSAGFLLVEPEGIGAIGDSAEGIAETWNAGNCCIESVTENVDDVGFVRAMLDALPKELCVDAKRVYSTGFSNGAMLSHRLACELSDRIAAIAPVSGGLGETDPAQKPAKTFFTCAPKRHVPVLHIHGTQDACYPFAGGAGPAAGVNFEPVNTTLATWLKINGCKDSSTTSLQKGKATCKDFACPADGAVTLCTIRGGGHYWPGGDDWPGSEIFCGLTQGERSADLDANDRIWAFLSAQALP